MKKVVSFGFIIFSLLIVSFFTVQKPTNSTTATNEAETSSATNSSEEVSKGDLPVVGILQMTSHPALDQIHQGIMDEFEAQGFIEGENVTFDYQNAQGEQDKLKSMSERFLQENAAVMIGIATPAAQALANVSKEIPVIMGAISDPVRANLVDSNEVPGRNVTGVTNYIPVQQQFDLIKELLPEAKTIGFLYSSSEDNSLSSADKAQVIAEDLGLTVIRATISNTNDLNQVAANLASQVDVIWVPNDNQLASTMATLVAVTNEAKIPVFPAVDSMVVDGGTASYSLNQHDIGVQTAKVAIDLLEGKDPGTYPVVVPKQVELIINKKQADLLNISIPEQLLSEARIVE